MDFFPLVQLCTELHDPLWFKDLCLTTKLPKGFTKVHKEIFRT
ncbi:MAG: hypothetical protein H6Q23_946 [Bacteroidetes bacterium]|nr:hypothetical protein [Bacteroidota bacterium]